ncbi:peroxiredoxin [Thiomicrorhabdus sediminis]|uniref:thioredoxin-dependent peroxiredoxin n=1 Tax=Thiomicrorhabdus sediminis TaxID=2580412 RepID=A0A4P9K7H8_9GAMM|nr:peroxiredoxin [Thiomicrorhabdus sediminis]QCU90420.1 peroxiredoxin [Thiomicrorhabdus sediminis]
MSIKIGDSISAFSLAATSDTTVTEQDLLGKYTVLYFYPKDSTPGCTTEGNDFSELCTQFAEKNCQIFGISMDSMKRHENFKAKQNFAFELISDPDAELCQQFGVYQMKKNFGKEYMGIVRSTFIIDPQGKLVLAWDKVKVKGHAAEVLEALTALQ